MKENKCTNVDVLIVGGGAAGLAAAIAAAERVERLRIVVLERGERVGRKIATTGNGRCNITNRDLSLAHFHGESVDFARHALSCYDLSRTTDFFARMGVLIKYEDSGKAYPYSLQAASVTDALRFRAAQLGVELMTGVTVTQIRRNLTVVTDQGNFAAKRVIVAAGGYAAPKTGSDGAGVKLLGALGHTPTRILPAIVQLKTDNSITRTLKGIKTDGVATVLADEKPLRREAGEILFTEYGLSGPPILQLSRTAVAQLGRACVEISLDIFPDYTLKQTEILLTARVKQLCDRTLEEFFTAMLNKRLGQAVLKACGFKLSMSVSELGAREIRLICAKLHDFRFKVTDTTGFSNAQTTAGGIKTRAFCAKTMESKLVPGLYAAGEVLDIDGDCGGYNLQWAWSSGLLAGTCAADSIAKTNKR